MISIQYIKCSFLFVILCFFGSFLSIAQESTLYEFEKIEEGNSDLDHSIQAILQDSYGYVWMSTWLGLIRYDGYEVKVYRPNISSKNGLKGNKITCLFEDSKQRLWIGSSYTGFYWYDRAIDGFVQYANDPQNMNSLSHNNVTTIIEDKNGLLWIGTENGLNSFDVETKKFIHYSNQPNNDYSLSNNFIVDLYVIDNGDLFVGTEDGLNRLQLSKNQQPNSFIRYSLTPANALSKDQIRHQYISTILSTPETPDILWIGTSIGLKKVKLYPEQSSKIDFETFYSNDNALNALSHSFVTDITMGRTNEEIWIGTLNGLNLFNTATNLFQSFYSESKDDFSISNNSVQSLFKDQFGQLWIGTEKGVNRTKLSNELFNNICISDKDDNMVTCIVSASDQSGIWIGTRGEGLLFVPQKDGIVDQNKIRRFQFENAAAAELIRFISDIVINENNTLWIATNGAGLIRVSESTLLQSSENITDYIQYNSENQLDDDYLMDIVVDKQQRIWIGYWDEGLGCFDPSNQTFSHYKHTQNLEIDLTSYPIVDMMTIPDQQAENLWLGTRGAGIYKVQLNKTSKTVEFINHVHYQSESEEGLSNNFVNCFYQQNESNLWIGTENGLSLLDVDRNQFSHFSEKDGLESNIIQSISGVDNTAIWMSTQKGISRMTFDEGVPKVKNFDAQDDLKDHFFHARSVAVLPEKRLAFGGVEGLTILQPDAVIIDTIAPKIRLSDFKIANQSIPIGKMSDDRVLLEKHISEIEHLNLSYTDNVISFEFVGLHFRDSKKLIYAYQLEGFNKDWVYTDATQRIAHYTNLPYNDYVFKVKAANNDGVWSNTHTLPISIAPPLWRTKAAYFLYVLLFILLFYSILRIMNMRTKYAHNLELEKMKRQSLEEINQMKLRFFTNISHELRTPLTLIISPLEQYIKDQSFNKKYYNSFVRMHHNANRLLTMINQLLDIRKSDAGLMKLNVSENNLTDFIGEIVLSFKELAQQKNIDFQFIVSPQKLTVWFDKNQIEKVFYNLLSNAFKFTPEGGTIRITFAEEHQKIQDLKSLIIKVQDSGIGIPRNQQKSIFDRFHQVNETLKYPTTTQSGTGIGLSLCKNIMEAHQGKIWVESEEGKGAVFYLAIPLGSAHFTEKEKLIENESVERISQYIVPENFKVLTNNERHDEQATIQNQAKILIVEDNADIRAYLRENLAVQYVVTEAVDGEDGVQKANTVFPDLIIADISMPKMNGIELCKNIKTNIHTSHIPVLLLTARTSLIFKIDGLETGADDYVTKPFNMHLLMARIKNLITSRQLLKEKFSKSTQLIPEGIVLNSLDDELLSQIDMVINKNIEDSDFTVEQLARSVYLSRMQLYRKLKALTGKSPTQIIRTARMQKAIELLKTKRYNISDITYMVGYNDLKSFRQQFKREHGMSPSEYFNNEAM